MEELFPHQQIALRKLSNGKILWGGVGSGKTRVAGEYYKLKEAPRHVYVITTAKKRDDFDWQNQFYELGIGPASGPTAVPEGTASIRKRRHHAEPSEGNAGTSGGAQHSENNGGPRSADSGEPHQDRGSGSDGDPRTLGEATTYLRGEGEFREAEGALRDRIGKDEVVGADAGSGVSSSASAMDRPDVGSGDIGLGEAGTFPYVLTVDSWNNIGKYADVEGAFFIFDEQRLVGSGDWTHKFLRIAKRNHWILLTATPGDTWMDYAPVFIANGFYKNRTALKREHVVYNTFTKYPKVDRYINVGKLLRHRHELLVEMPYERHTRRHHVEVDLPYDKELLELVLKKRWHVYEERPLRDVGEMFMVARKVVNSDPSRLEMVKGLWENHPRLIVFYNFNYELESLRSLSDGLRDGLQSPCERPSSSKKTSSDATLIDSSMSGSSGSWTDSSTAIAEWNGHKHQPIPDTSRWLYLVQYTAGAEGWNCTTTDAMIFYSRNYSYKIWEQAQGRIDRLNTPFKDLWYYDFTSDSFIDRAIGRSLKAKETFNEAKYASLFRG